MSIIKLNFNDEIKLTSELQKGNKHAYSFLYKKYFNSLISYCTSLTKDKYKAEDIVQNTIEKLWQNRCNIEIGKPIKPYLYKSVYNSFINDYNKNKKFKAILEHLYIDKLNAIIEQDESVLKEKTSKIDKAIADLPKRNKDVFLLNKKEGYSYEEIAEILNISINTVENHMVNALARIRKNVL